ncbi:hypothetical protein BGZ98_002616 [Dissophora globulifera]|nr:hypothetical protein BGZ98_002616 [Dissophora globulifera]
MSLGEPGYYRSEDIQSLFAMWRQDYQAPHLSQKGSVDIDDDDMSGSSVIKGKGYRRSSQTSAEGRRMGGDDDEDDEDGISSEIDEILDDDEEGEESEEVEMDGLPNDGYAGSGRSKRRRKPHFCSTCGKQFNVASNLKRHIRTHATGKRNGTGGAGSLLASDAILPKTPLETAIGLGHNDVEISGSISQPMQGIAAVAHLRASQPQLEPQQQPPLPLQQQQEKH